MISDPHPAGCRLIASGVHITCHRRIFVNQTCSVLVPPIADVSAFAAYPQLRPVAYAGGKQEGEPTPEQRAAVAIVVGNDDIDQVGRFLTKLPELQLVQTLSSGFEQWVAWLPPRVALSNGSGAHGASVAEWIIAQLLAHYRGLGHFAEAQRAERWLPSMTDSLIDKRVSIIGSGNIGRTLRTMLRAFDCRVELYGRCAREGVQPIADFGQRAASQQVVVLLPHASKEFEQLVDAAFLAALPDGAVIVNASRGIVIDTDALLAETRSGRVFALLDVTDPEPLPAAHPLWAVDNVVITPHIAGGTPGVWTRATTIAAQQIDLYLRGHRPPNLMVESAGWTFQQA
jgi:phosphoglycerate dehydrogenase-like enzyme